MFSSKNDFDLTEKKLKYMNKYIHNNDIYCFYRKCKKIHFLLAFFFFFFLIRIFFFNDISVFIDSNAPENYFCICNHSVVILFHCKI